MMEEQSNWLPHLMGRPIKEVNELNSYLITLEAWRREIGVKLYAKPTQEHMALLGNKSFPKNYFGKLYRLKLDNFTNFFYDSTGDLNSQESYRNVRLKPRTKQLLAEAGILTPAGKEFSKDIADEVVIHYANELGFPVVLKPTNKGMGEGVFANIQDSSSFRFYLSVLRNRYNYKDVMVEKYIVGKDCRAYVVGNDVVSVISRVAANITGDGKNTIRSLIEQKNRMRRKNPHLSQKPIIIDAEVIKNLKSFEFGIKSIPTPGKLVVLKNNSNASAGGETVDITDYASSDVLRVAVKAAKTLGLAHGSVDMIVKHDSEVQADDIVVLELNSPAVIGGHVFPLLGKGRDIPKAIIDYYYPDSCGKGLNNYCFYYNSDSVMSKLKKKGVASVEIDPPPSVNIKMKKKLIVEGHVQGVGYRKWIKEKAVELGLYGYVKNLKNGNVEVVVFSRDKAKINHFEKLSRDGPLRAKVERVTVSDYNHPVIADFLIISGKKSLRKRMWENEKWIYIWSKAKPLRVVVKKILKKVK